MGQIDLISPYIHFPNINHGIYNEAKALEMFSCHFKYLVSKIYLKMCLFILPGQGQKYRLGELPQGINYVQEQVKPLPQHAKGLYHFRAVSPA